MKKFWRHLEDIFRLCLLDLLVKTNIFALLTCLQKTSSRCINKINTFILMICLQDVFNTSCRNIYMNIFILMIWFLKKSSRRLAKTPRYLQDFFKTFWRRFQNVFKIRDVWLYIWLWLGYKISKSKLFGHSKTFQTAFF